MEVAGLAIGVAGLSGLFSACVDCFELVQRGRYLGKDFLLLETKFTNQRLRLITWGRAVDSLTPVNMTADSMRMAKFGTA